MVNQFMRCSGRFSWCREAAQLVDHATANSSAHPHIAVNDPYKVAFGFAICSAHVSDLGIRPQEGSVSVMSGSIIVLLFDEDSCIVVVVVSDHFLNGFICCVRT